jgi:hypothetical protein
MSYLCVRIAGQPQSQNSTIDGTIEQLDALFDLDINSPSLFLLGLPQSIGELVGERAVLTFDALKVQEEARLVHECIVRHLKNQRPQLGFTGGAQSTVHHVQVESAPERGQNLEGIEQTAHRGTEFAAHPATNAVAIARDEFGSRFAITIAHPRKQLRDRGWQRG